MIKRNNYKEYDNLILYVKKNKLKEIIGHYEVFGWEVMEQKENKRYQDIIDVSFVRPHKINHKDELQLQQVYMEEKLNELGRLDKYKYSKITTLGLCFGISVIALIVWGLIIALKMNIVVGIVISFLGFGVLVLGFLILPKIYKKEKEEYLKKDRQLERQILDIFKRVIELAGGENEKD